MPREPYKKLLDIPLHAPDTSVPLMAKQIPENILWLPDARGFKKRPGSMAMAYEPNILEGEAAYMCQLLSVQTPAAKLAMYEDLDASWGGVTLNDKLKLSDSTIVGYRWGNGTSSNYGLFELNEYRAFVVPDAETAAGGAQRLTRSRLSRSDSAYYFGTDELATEVTDAMTVGELSLLALPSATLETSQAARLALTLSAEPLQSRRRMTDDKVFSLRAGEMASGGVSYAPLNGMNLGRIDAAANSSGAFIGGSGGPIFHYDGWRAYVAGCYDMRAFFGYGFDFDTSGAGVLSGVYKYTLSHKQQLPSGELVEGELMAKQVVPSVTTKQIQLDWGSEGSPPLLALTEVNRPYRMRAYTTNTTGNVITVTINEAHDLRVGDHVVLMKGGSFFNYVTSMTQGRTRVVAVNGQQVTFNGSNNIPWAGTTYITVGGYFQLYRTKAGGTLFYERAVYALPEIFTGGFTLTDNTADSALGNEYVETAFSREPTPSVVHSLCTHQGRLVALTTSANPYYVRYTDPVVVTNDEGTNQPVTEVSSPTVIWSPASSMHYFPAGNSFQLDTLAGDNAPRAVVSMNDVLYIFLSNAIYYVQGTLGEVGGYTVSLLSNQVGCRDPRSVLVVDDSIFFVSDRGLMQLSGTSLSDKAGIPIRRFLQEPDVITATYFWRNKNLLLLSANHMVQPETQSSSNTFKAQVSRSNAKKPYGWAATAGRPRTFVLDMTTGLWAVWNIDCYNGAVEQGDDLVIASPTITSASELHVPQPFLRLSDVCNWTDNGRQFTARYYSEWFDNGVPLLDKQFNRLVLYSNDNSEAGGQNFALSVHTERDWMAGSRLQDFGMTDFQTPGYGGAPYGSQPYGDPSRPYKVIPLSNQKVKSLRVVLENNEANGNFCINAMALETTDTYDQAKDS